MGGVGRAMPKVFALFTAGSMASLALPGMSGFVSELTIFLGFAQSDAYHGLFKSLIIFLAAVGLILTPIYLLSMLRRVFYGEQSADFDMNSWFDARPREIFITLCLLVPIIGIGLYPKVATQTYDVKTVDVATQLGDNFPVLARESKFLQLANSIAPEIAE
jgi:NAD(P)H-quinone oxidoreductase subunit 4